MKGCGRKIGSFDCCTVILGNSLELTRELPERCVSAIITDPPYGLGNTWNFNKNSKQGKSRLWNNLPNWDIPIDILELKRLLGLGEVAVCWGGNLYELPPAKCWLIWDKIQSFSGSDFEMAWTNLSIPPRAFRMSRIDAYYNKIIFKKEHPAEKPIQLLEWCIQKAGNPETILDPFCGSGSTLVAGKRLGRHFLGFEIDPHYHTITEKRLMTTEGE